MDSKEMEFTAKTVNFLNDGYSTVLSFADDEYEPLYYVILQKLNNPVEQDVALKQDKVHMEIGGLNLSGYNYIDSIKLKEGAVYIRLRNEAVEKNNINMVLTIKIPIDVLLEIDLNKAIKIFEPS